jgi:hypothetical protein
MDEDWELGIRDQEFGGKTRAKRGVEFLDILVIPNEVRKPELDLRFEI